MDITIDCEGVDITTVAGIIRTHRVKLWNIDVVDIKNNDADLLDIIGEEAARKHFGIEEGT